MKNILLILLTCVLLFAKSDKLSPIALPNGVFINLNSEKCDVSCLKNYIKQERYFSFLANYNQAIHVKEDEFVSNLYRELSARFSIASPLLILNTSGNMVKVAILVPQKRIRRYAITAVNSTIAYLFARNNDFEIEVFNSIDESEEALARELDNIRRREFQFVIAPLTPQGANFVSRNAEGLLVYIPTIHRSFTQTSANNIIYGGISYQEQIKKLANFANQKIAIFSDGSVLGEQLDSMVEGEFLEVGYKNQLTTQKLNLKPMLKGNYRLQGSSIFLNMPLVKTSLLASQLRAYDIFPHALLSTQINYHPMLISLTQYLDRKKLYLANSIQNTPYQLNATNSIFGHSITYDWVNYATSIGIDFLYTRYFNQDREAIFKESIQNNQVQYTTTIMKSGPNGFYSISE